jgi:DMSO/TMAO reductase YedYZ molybdopterin-dependent catalytic subunit
MKRVRMIGRLAVLCAVIGLLVFGMTQAAGCGSEGSADAVVQVVTATGSQTFTLKDLKKMPAVEAYGGIKNSAGNITPPATFTGVAITELLASVGGLPAGSGVTFIAKDGYKMTMSGGQVNNGDFITYDVSTGDEKTIEDQLQLVLAYETEGKALDPERDGTFRLAILSPEANEVTDGHWWVKWVTQIEVKTMTAEWALTVDGALQEQVDRGSFDSCSAPKCHGVSWKDEQGVTWSGVPFYYLVGRADDEAKHDNGAFNSALAADGYDIEVVGGDGYTVTLNSADIALTKEYILANKMNGEDLAGEDAPLRLVGPAVDSKMSVGGVTEIRLLLK